MRRSFVLVPLVIGCGGEPMNVPDATMEASDDVSAMDGGSPEAEGGSQCADFNALKNVYFGDLHEHTSFSFDAYSFDTRNTPLDAYAFARGKALQIAGAQADGGGPIVQLSKPLDFLAVTDHSEFLALSYGCGADLQGNPYDPNSPYYNSNGCKAYRSTNPVTQDIVFAGGIAIQNALCDGGACDPVIQDAWKAEQAAAAAAYSPCKFTSLVAYEWTHHDVQTNATLHKNVIFGTDKVPARPLDSLTYSTQPALWSALDSNCKDTDGCQAITIPHNSNLSKGGAFVVPPGSEAQMQKYQRLVEIFQHKGGSECFYGQGSNDPDCNFEYLGGITEPNDPKSFVRQAVEDGIARQAQTKQNPLQMGFVGATDDHDGTPGYNKEDAWQGHAGRFDDGPGKRIYAPDGGIDTNVGFNPGGITGVWAEQNTRDAIFGALVRRETFATSGPRIVVRFFQTYSQADACADAGFPKQLVSSGAVPMGGTFAPNAAKPRFVVAAWKDAHDLERVDIIKAWIDQNGTPQDQIVQTMLQPSQTATACMTWEDPDPPTTPALYYARVLEVATPRWSVYDCAKAGLANPEQCKQGGALDVNIHERAWTSPIWFVP